MTFGEVKNEIFNLNFENSNDYDGDVSLLPQAINRAMSVITTEVRPLFGSFVIASGISQNGNSTRKQYDLKELSKEDGRVTFLSILSIENQEGEEVFSYEIRRNQTLYFDEGFNSFPVTVFYKKSFARFDEKTPDNTKIDLDEDLLVLVPLLCAYFVWHDDDRARSQELYTQYEIRRDGILYNQRKRVAKVATVVNIEGGGF